MAHCTSVQSLHPARRSTLLHDECAIVKATCHTIPLAIHTASIVRQRHRTHSELHTRVLSMGRRPPIRLSAHGPPIPPLQPSRCGPARGLAQIRGLTARSFLDAWSQGHRRHWKAGLIGIAPSPPSRHTHTHKDTDSVVALEPRGRREMRRTRNASRSRAHRRRAH